MKKVFLLFIATFFHLTIFSQSDSLIQNWTFGAEKGFAQIQGEVKSKSGFAFGFFAEKHINKILSARIQIGMGTLQGQDLKPSTNWLNHPVWNGKINSTINYNNAPTNSIYNNFKTNYMEGSLQGVFYFTQLPFIKNKSKFEGFLFAGIGVMRYKTLVDAANLNGDIYDFSTLDPTIEDRILPNITNLLDGKYESSIHSEPQIIPLYHSGLGLKWNFKNNLTLALSHRVSWTGKDDLDASQWNKNNELNNENDLFHLTSISLSYTFFKTKKVKIPKPIEPGVIEPPLTEEPEPIIEEQIVEEPEEVVLTVEEKEVVKRAFDNLEFETSKAIISNTSFNSLNELANLLSNHPNWKLKVIPMMLEMLKII